jgi:hypothetical protein
MARVWAVDRLKPAIHAPTPLDARNRFGSPSWSGTASWKPAPPADPRDAIRDSGSLLTCALRVG